MYFSNQSIDMTIIKVPINYFKNNDNATTKQRKKRKLNSIYKKIKSKIKLPTPT